MLRVDSLEKTLMLGRIESRRIRGPEGEMVGWHHQLNGQEFEQTPGDSEGQGSLMCCNPLNHKESDVTEHSPEIIIGTRGKLWKKKNLIHTFHSLWSTVGK